MASREQATQKWHRASRRPKYDIARAGDPKMASREQATQI
jgi:hypothetical protein